MYNVLQNQLFDQDERIDILMTVKTTVKVGLEAPEAAGVTKRVKKPLKSE